MIHKWMCTNPFQRETARKFKEKLKVKRIDY